MDGDGMNGDGMAEAHLNMGSIGKYTYLLQYRPPKATGPRRALVAYLNHAAAKIQRICACFGICNIQ